MLLADFQSSTPAQQAASPESGKGYPTAASATTAPYEWRPSGTTTQGFVPGRSSSSFLDDVQNGCHVMGVHCDLVILYDNPDDALYGRVARRLASLHQSRGYATFGYDKMDTPPTSTTGTVAFRKVLRPLEPLVPEGYYIERNMQLSLTGDEAAHPLNLPGGAGGERVYSTMREAQEACDSTSAEALCGSIEATLSTVAPGQTAARPNFAWNSACGRRGLLGASVLAALRPRSRRFAPATTRT